MGMIRDQRPSETKGLCLGDDITQAPAAWPLSSPVSESQHFARGGDLLPEKPASAPSGADRAGVGSLVGALWARGAPLAGRSQCDPRGMAFGVCTAAEPNGQGMVLDEVSPAGQPRTGTAGGVEEGLGKAAA